MQSTLPLRIAALAVNGRIRPMPPDFKSTTSPAVPRLSGCWNSTVSLMRISGKYAEDVGALLCC